MAGIVSSNETERVPWPLLLIVSLLSGLPYLAAEVYLLDGGWGFPLDDSWIHLQFARNLAAGEGLSYNASELVSGSTAPLWTALLSLLFLLPGPVLAWAKVLGLAAHFAAVLGVYGLGRELRLGRSFAILAACLTAGTSWLVWSAGAAMEVGLFCALSSFGMVLHLRERRDRKRHPLSLPVLGLTLLARPEGALLLVSALADRLLRWEKRDDGLHLELADWRRTAQGLLAAALAVGPVVLFNLWVGGSVLPSTFATKAGYGRSGLPSGQFLDTVQGILFQAQPVATLLAPVGCLVLCGWLGSSRDRGLLPVVWLLGMPLAYAVLSSDRLLVGNFGRYFFILFPVLVVMAVLGCQELLARLPGTLRLGPVTLRWPVWVAGLLLLPTVFAMVRGVGLYTRSVLNVQDSDVAMAKALAPVLPPQAVLAINDIGAMKFLLPNRVIDLAGIATPEIHDWARASMAEVGSHHPGILAFIRDQKPDYVVVFPNWFPPLDRDPDFTPLLRLQVEDNITMGGDELVLYRTPWTRYPLTGPAAGPRPAVDDSLPNRGPSDDR